MECEGCTDHFTLVLPAGARQFLHLWAVLERTHQPELSLVALHTYADFVAALPARSLREEDEYKVVPQASCSMNRLYLSLYGMCVDAWGCWRAVQYLRC